MNTTSAAGTIGSRDGCPEGETSGVADGPWPAIRSRWSAPEACSGWAESVLCCGYGCASNLDSGETGGGNEVCPCWTTGKSG